MKTDDLREIYPGSKIHFNCKDGDEAFTDDYVLWLENRLITILQNDLRRESIRSSIDIRLAFILELLENRPDDFEKQLKCNISILKKLL